MLGVGVLSLALFCWVETKVREPILPMSLFKSPTFVAVAVSLCLGWMSFGMYQFYFPHLSVPPLPPYFPLSPCINLF